MRVSLFSLSLKSYLFLWYEREHYRETRKVKKISSSLLLVSKLNVSLYRCAVVIKREGKCF